MEKEEKLRELFTKSKISKPCRNLKIAKNKQIISDLGMGDPNSPLFFIGEAPGRKEQETGFPFVGKAGEVLQENLENIGLKREKIWVGNLVKYRPTQNNGSKNRKPSKSEINACLPLLEKEIEIIDPKIIITLGLTALNSLLKKKYNLKSISGKKIEYKNAILFPTYHPAAAYRFPKIEKLFQRDFEKLRMIIHKEIGIEK